MTTTPFPPEVPLYLLYAVGAMWLFALLVTCAAMAWSSRARRSPPARVAPLREQTPLEHAKARHPSARAPHVAKEVPLVYLLLCAEADGLRRWREASRYLSEPLALPPDFGR